MPVIDDVKIKKEFVDFEIFWNAIKVLVFYYEGEPTNIRFYYILQFGGNFLDGKNEKKRKEHEIFFKLFT